MAFEYDDIINLPYQKSKRKRHMRLIDRAAQFSPFAALTTHSDSIKETGRLTCERVDLAEDSMRVLDFRFHVLLENICDHPLVSVTYFVKDRFKSGGEYVTVSGRVRKINGVDPIIYFEDGSRIPMRDVIGISGDIF